MCGVFGMFGFDSPPPWQGRGPALVNHLRHRGPDAGAWWADGPFFLGHRRLSIVGLASGSQPMATAEGDLVVVFNGEIYNYPELRLHLERRGHRFRTSSDTEVLLHGYREWGIGLPEHLTGMFAFALADRQRMQLFLARDRLGEKPLFVRRTPRYLAFASEVRPLAALPDLPRRLHLPALARFLLLNYVPGRDCLLDGVERVAPGSWQLYGRSFARRGVFWQPPVTSDPALEQAPLEEVLASCRKHIDRAVKLNLQSDVPVGVFLSGGMDSALVAESAMRQGCLNQAFCLDFAEASHSEYGSAKHVADGLGLPLQRVELTAEALRQFLQLVEHADDPLADSSSLAVYTLCRQAARENKVVLGGDGGDEIFGGYLTYAASRLHAGRLCSLPHAWRRLAAWCSCWLPTGEGKVSFSYKLRRFLRAAHLDTGQAHFTWNGTWMPDEAARLVRPPELREAIHQVLDEFASHHGLSGPCSLFDLQRADVSDYLPNDILTKADRMSMAHGLEVRAPFLEHELAAWALRLPEHFKIGPKGRLKYVLRELARRTFGPVIADRRKQGFSIPVHTWLRGPFARQVRDHLEPSALARLEVLDPIAIGRALGEHLSGRRSLGFELWGLAVLVAWHRSRIETTPAVPSHHDLQRLLFPQPRSYAA
jgi:asparagine synthase (glutamine-hydrolysing)